MVVARDLQECATAGRCQGCDADAHEDHGCPGGRTRLASGAEPRLAEDVALHALLLDGPRPDRPHAAGARWGERGSTPARWSAAAARRCCPRDIHEHGPRPVRRPCFRGELAALHARLTAPDYRRDRWSRSPAADGDDRRRAGARPGTRATSCAPSAPRRRELSRRLAQQAAVATARRAALRAAPLEDARRTPPAAPWPTASDVELVASIEHLGAGMMRVRAGVGWPRRLHRLRVRDRSRSRDEAGSELRRRRRSSSRTSRATSVWRARAAAPRTASSPAPTCCSASADAPAGVLGAHTAHAAQFGAQDLDFLHGRRPRAQRRASRACASRSASATTRSTTRSPACRTARCCWSASATRSSAPTPRAAASRCSSSTSTT